MFLFSHITCAPLADVSFERRFYPKRNLTVCAFHNTTTGFRLVVLNNYIGRINYVSALIDMRRFDIKQRVYVHSEEFGITGRGRILSICENNWATVDFMDSSVSKDLYICDIKSCECSKFGCSGGSHLPGALV